MNSQVFAVAIDDQAWQKVAFGVDAAAQMRIDIEAFAEAVRGSEPLFEKRLVDRRVAAIEQTDGDLGFLTVERFAENRAAIIHH